MTRYFYDTEFLDDGKTIEFISIGIVRDTGEEYYAVNADADWSRIHADPWLTANVVNQLPPEDSDAWKPTAQIAEEVKAFILATPSAELWAWFSAYDHVVLSQLFGKMIDMPRGIPMFTNDLRSLIAWLGVKKLPALTSGLHDALVDARHVKVRYDYVQAIMQAPEQRPAPSPEPVTARRASTGSAVAKQWTHPIDVRIPATGVRRPQRERRKKQPKNT